MFGSLGENIADNGAVKGMYGAYQTFVERNGPEPTLPDLNYTQNQLFWISAAQLWCAVTRPEFDTLQVCNAFYTKLYYTHLRYVFLIHPTKNEVYNGRSCSKRMENNRNLQKSR